MLYLQGLISDIVILKHKIIVHDISKDKTILNKILVEQFVTIQMIKFSKQTINYFHCILSFQRLTFKKE